MSAQHINAFCIDWHETYLFAGDKSGQLWVIDLDSFKVLHKVQAHPGTIQGMAAHPHERRVALLGKDRAVSVWSYDEQGRPSLTFHHSIRDYSPDALEPIHSECQGLAFHPSAPRIATRSGNSALVELSYADPQAVELVTCVRVCEYADIATVAYEASGERILVGSTQGHISVVKNGALVSVTKFPDVSETMHWFEPLPDGAYLVANDSRKLLRFHPDRPDESRWGQTISRDDFEHVAWNSVSERVFASSFDRNVYEIDPETLDKQSVVYRAPFKVRWIRTLRRAPDRLIVQVRDGSLVRVDLATGRVDHVVKETQCALWSLARTHDGGLIVAGEGQRAWHVQRGAFDARQRSYDLTWQPTEIAAAPATYTKRVVSHPTSGRTFFGQIDGTLLVSNGNETRVLCDVGSAIRDLAVMDSSPWVFAATEAGEVLRVNAKTGKIEMRASGPEPVWSLSLNEERRWLAFGERHGRLVIVDVDDFKEIATTLTRLPKRMKWLDRDTLLVTRSSDIDRITHKGGSWTHETSLFEGNSNTIEDFDWDAARRYLVAVTYNKTILLFDLASAKPLTASYDDMDYMKGVAFLSSRLNPTGYELDFMTVGRSGVGRLYRIHDEQIMSLGVSRGALSHG